MNRQESVSFNSGNRRRLLRRRTCWSSSWRGRLYCKCRQSTPSFTRAKFIGPIGTPSIGRANTDGSGRSAIISSLGYQPRDIAIDSVAGKTYWSTYSAPGIRRANLDGTQIETILPTSVSPNLAIDPVRTKLIFELSPDTGPDSFYQCNLDGSNTQLMFSVQTGPWDFAVDATAGKIYWTTDISGAGPSPAISRANYDGTQVETLVSGLCYGYIALDPQGGKMYWETNDTGNRRIQRANLNGSSVQTLLTQANIPGSNTFLPAAMALDLANKKLYFNNSLFAGDSLYSASFDGSGLKLAFNLGSNSAISQFAVVPKPATVVLLAIGGLALGGFVLRRRRLATGLPMR